MPDTLNKREAIDFLGLDAKLFDNYFKLADEIPVLARNNGRGRFSFEKQALKKWQESRVWRTVELTKEDYAECLDFALAMHFRGYVTSDWGTGRQREFGQKLTNWVKGQLGEVALKKFFKQQFDVDIELDFNIHDTIVPQDVIGIIKKGKVVLPRVGISIKASKPKNAYLVLGEVEINGERRQSDYYVFCRPDIPDDHLLRIAKTTITNLIKNQKHYPRYKDFMPDFENIPCEIAGWCHRSELERVTEIPGQKFDNGFRYVRKSGLLYRSKDEWRHLIEKL